LNKTSNKGLYLLFVLQGIFLFGLGVFGNKVAEIIKLSPNALLAYIIVFMTVSLVITVAISRLQNRRESSSQEPRATSWSDTFAKVVLNRIVTIFPLGVVTGVVTAFLAINLVPHGRVSFFYPVVTHYYEILSYMVAAITLLMISRKRSHFPLVISYAIGFGLSLPTVILMLRPEQNFAYYTFLGWLAIIVTATIVRSQMADGLYRDVKSLVQSLTKERAD
jgi:hypothetical protein